MARQVLKLEIDGLIVKAKSAIVEPQEQRDAIDCVCPDCKKPKAKKRPMADLTQFGFTWDLHKTVFTCKCGCIFYHEYRIWHINESEAQDV